MRDISICVLVLFCSVSKNNTRLSSGNSDFKSPISAPSTTAAKIVARKVFPFLLFALIAIMSPWGEHPLPKLDHEKKDESEKVRFATPKAKREPKEK